MNFNKQKKHKQIFKIDFVTDKRRADEISKNRRSTDLFLKGLYLSFFENNNLNYADYRIDGDVAALRKRNVYQRGAISSSNFPAMRNYNKLVVDFSKLASYNETKDILFKTNDETKSTDKRVNNNAFKDANLSSTTLTSGAKAVVQSNSVTEKYERKNTNKNDAQPFLIQVY